MRKIKNFLLRFHQEDNAAIEKVIGIAVGAVILVGILAVATIGLDGITDFLKKLVGVGSNSDPSEVIPE